MLCVTHQPASNWKLEINCRLFVPVAPFEVSCYDFVWNKLMEREGRHAKLRLSGKPKFFWMAFYISEHSNVHPAHVLQICQVQEVNSELHTNVNNRATQVLSSPLSLSSWREGFWTLRGEEIHNPFLDSQVSTKNSLQLLRHYVFPDAS